MIESGYGSLGETRISWREGDDTRDRAAGQILLPHLTGESSLICQNEESNSVRPGHSSSPSVPLKVTFVGIMPTLFRSEEHTSELQSRFDLVCRLLLEKKKKTNENNYIYIKK